MRRGLIGRDSQSSVFDISFAGSAFRPATGIVRTNPPFLVSFVRTETFYSTRFRSTQLGLSTVRIFPQRSPLQWEKSRLLTKILGIKEIE